MPVPFSYNIRNLVVRKTTTLMTAFGIALSVAILVASLALVNGLRTVFANTANPLQLLVLRKGSTRNSAARFRPKTLPSCGLKQGLQSTAQANHWRLKN